MPAISKCPKCNAQVSLPQGADPQSQVQCPLCGEAFLLQAALEIAPPELIVLDGPETAAVQTEAWAADESEAESPTDQNAAFDFGTDQPVAEATFPGDLVPRDEAATSLYPARQPSGWDKRQLMRQIVSVVFGGIVGLAIGYFVLIWIGGPRKDFLQLGQRLPGFLLPSGFHASDDAKEDALEPAEAPP